MHRKDGEILYANRFYTKKTDKNYIVKTTLFITNRTQVFDCVRNLGIDL